MTDKRIAGLARLIVEYSTRVQPGDQVMIWGFPMEPTAAPLVRELYRRVLEADGHPVTHVDLEGLDYLHYKVASDAQLDRINPIVRLVYETFDVDIAINAPSNLHSLNQIPPDRLRRVSLAHKEVAQTAFQRTAAGKYRWLLTYFPTPSMAQVMQISLAELEDFYYRCTFADTEDPIGAWRAFAAEQDRIVDWLSGKCNIQLKGPDVDLSFSIEGRNVISDAGHCNLPDGEIETSPVEDSVDGWVRFAFPAIVRGRTVEGIELQFENGRVERATARKGQDFLLEMIDTDPGARYVGEFAIGTNEAVDRFTQRILFDEKMAGTIHLALGNGYPESGSQNKSAIHWDMICDMRDGGQIIVDGDLIYEAGTFKI